MDKIYKKYIRNTFIPTEEKYCPPTKRRLGQVVSRTGHPWLLCYSFMSVSISTEMAGVGGSFNNHTDIFLPAQYMWPGVGNCLAFFSLENSIVVQLLLL
jgi:hypothetical protein